MMGKREGNLRSGLGDDAELIGNSLEVRLGLLAAQNETKEGSGLTRPLLVCPMQDTRNLT
jgi:hypothetical protein